MEKTFEVMTLPLAKIEISGKNEIEKISVHMFEDFGGERRYECHISQNFKMFWNGEVEINHKSKIRFRLQDEEVKALKEKGLIKIKV